MKFTDTYAEIRSRHSSSFRTILRGMALDGLTIADRLIGREADLSKPRIQFLYFHHVFRDEEASLRRLLEKLSKHHRFISYGEAVDRILSGRIEAPYVCFSSDDGFRNNVRAAEILSEFDISGCFFINPGLIGLESPERIAEHCATRLHLPPIAFMNWDEVAGLQRGGHEIGSHTMWHINVAQTPVDVFRQDCIDTHRLITERCGPVRHFSFPYGRFNEFSEEARSIVFATGYESCSAATRGCHINHDRILLPEELCIRRDPVILATDERHLFHFIARNSRSANIQTNLFPYPRT